jgi:transglutaminase-like putative cysteine protease
MTVATASAGVRRTASRRRTRRLSTDNVVASLSLTLLTVVTALGMCRVFGDWRFLQPLVTVAVVVHLASLVMRTARVPALVALPALALVTYEAIALLFYKDTTRALLPSRDTLELLRLDLRLVWTQFPNAVAPVPSDGSYLVAAAFGIGLVALLSDAFAFRAFGRVEAVVPGGVLFIFTAALGTDRNRVAVAALWFATAIVVVALLRALHSGTDDSWLGRRGRAMGAAVPATLACAAVAAVAAAAIGPMLPGAGDEPLLDTHNGAGQVTEVLSPLVDIRSRLVNRSGTEMFVVDAPVGQYWRVTGLSEFDGRTWGLRDSKLEDGGFLREPAPNGTVVDQRITISRLGGKLIPSAFAPTFVSQDNVRWLPNTDTLVYDEDTMEPGDVFDITADVTEAPADVLRTLTASSPPSDEFFQLPSAFPADAATLAREVTATATTPYDQAIQLQNFFRTFTYDLDVQSGHSNDAVMSFLRIRRGYCEQFAGTFAAMARSLGLPARVAVGFTPGERQPDGSFHVYGRHAHAWPEVWFDGVGWVLFEPTPGRGAPGHEATTGVAPAQDDTPAPTGAPGDEAGAAVPSTTIAPVTPITEPLLLEPVIGDLVAPVGAPETATDENSGTSTATWILLAVVVIAAWMIAMPVLVRRFTRGGDTPAAQVIDAWHGTVGALVMAGAPAPAGATPLEYAVRIEDRLGVDHRGLSELARFVTRAIYSPSGVGESAALRAGVLRTELLERAREMTPWYTRLLSRLDPRLARQRLVG